jgi:hypothetical protein
VGPTVISPAVVGTVMTSTGPIIFAGP